MLGILVAAAEPAEPSGRAELHQIEQLFLFIGLIAHQIDLLDLGDFTFHHIEHDTDTIALQFSDGSRHRDAIFSPRNVLALQLLGGFIQRALVEDACFGQPRIFHIILELILGEILDPVDFDTRDGRTLAHLHDQYAPLDFQQHILEKAGGIQGVNRGSGLLIIHHVADFDGQITEYRTGFGTLYAFDADIPDSERLDRPG